MNKNIVRLIPFLFLVFAIIFARESFAKIENKETTLPLDVEGIYDVPNNPHLKLRVFVYKIKEAKPGDPNLNLVCQEDPNSIAKVPSVGWKLPSDWKYTLNTSSIPSSLSSNSVNQIASNAFSVWQAVLLQKVNISKNSINTTINKAVFDGKNIIAWGRTSSSALAVTYTWYNPSTGIVSEVDTIMNQKYPWYWNAANTRCTSQNAYDAQNILTHELGHWVGLDDRYTSEYVNATMYGYGSRGETKKDTLSTGDVDGVFAIY